MLMQPPLTLIAGVGLLIAVVGFTSADVQAAPTPIAACEDYADALTKCLGPAARSRAPSIAPRDRASWQRAELTCQNGLAQLRRTCR